MKREERQIPMYHVTQGTNLESIIIAKSLARFNAKISETIKEVQDFCSRKYRNSNLTDIQCLANAAKKVGELISLYPKNLEIEGLGNNIEVAARELSDPAINWITENQGFARIKINEIEQGLYPGRLMGLVEDLSIMPLLSLRQMDQNTLNILIALFDEVSSNSKFKSEEDQRLKLFCRLLRASIK